MLDARCQAIDRCIIEVHILGEPDVCALLFIRKSGRSITEFMYTLFYSLVMDGFVWSSRLLLHQSN